MISKAFFASFLLSLSAVYLCLLSLACPPNDEETYFAKHNVFPRRWRSMDNGYEPAKVSALLLRWQIALFLLFRDDS
jgi:hypothetical protein